MNDFNQQNNNGNISGNIFGNQTTSTGSLFGNPTSSSTTQPMIWLSGF